VVVRVLEWESERASKGVVRTERVDNRYERSN